MRDQVCSSIGDFLSRADADSARPDRFVSRFILVRDLGTWRELVRAMESRVARVIRLSERCSAHDVLPDTSVIRSIILENRSDSALVLPVSEVARFQPSVVNDIADWLELESPGMVRYYFPLFDADDIFAQASRQVHRYRDGLLAPAWRIEGGSPVHVEATPFSVPAIEPGVVCIDGVQDYLALWERSGGVKVRLQSTRANRLRSRVGFLSIDVFGTPFEFASAKLCDLPTDWASMGTDDEWEWLVLEFRGEKSLTLLAARLLNKRSYDKCQVFDLWSTYTPHQRWIAWLWANLSEPKNSYLGRMVAVSSSWREFAEVLALDALDEGFCIHDLGERKYLLTSMGIQDAGDSFWQLYDSAPNDLVRLRSLWSAPGRQEKEVYRIVGDLLREGIDESLWYDTLEIVAPHVAAYLRAPVGIDDKLARYLSAYNRAKITIPKNEVHLSHVDNIAAEILSTESRLDHAAREKILEETSASRKVFWIDGLGLEWIELLRHELQRRNVSIVDLYVARANLPSITETNKGVGWDNENQLERGLDTIAHRNTYECVADLLHDQFEVISRAADRIAAATHGGRQVIVTSDHGLTSLSTGERIDSVEPMAVDNSGRFGTIGVSSITVLRDRVGPWIVESRDGKEYICLENHSRFRGGRSSSYEAHGGATIEESLVPVLVAESSDHADGKATDVVSFSEVIRLDPNGCGVAVLVLSEYAQSVAVRIGSRLFSCTSTSEFTWTGDIIGMAPGHYSACVIIDKVNTQSRRVQLMKGITSDDMGI